MLKDQRADEGIFQMSLGFLGKHQVSDRDAVIEALKAQGKWKEEDKKGNKEEKFNTTEESNKVPFISSFCVLAIVLMTFMMYTRSIRR